jgi:hypothetical protein
MKKFLLNKLVLRISYVVGAYCTAQLVSVLSLPEVQETLLGAGLHIQVLDPTKLKLFIGGFVMVAGEFVFALFHKKVVMPKVEQQKAEELEKAKP